jgi:hypothetical protein
MPSVHGIPILARQLGRLGCAAGVVALLALVASCGDDTNTGPPSHVQMAPRPSSPRLSSGVSPCYVSYSPLWLSGNPVSGSRCGLPWSMSVPLLAAGPSYNGFWWDTDSKFVTCCFHGELQNGPLIVNFGSAVKSATILTWDGWLGFPGAPPGVKIRAVNAFGDTLLYAVTDGVNPVTLPASGIRQLILYPVEKGTVNGYGDKYVEMEQYQIEYEPECPPLNEPVLDDSEIRAQFADAMERSNPDSLPGMGKRVESGGVIWKMPDGTYRATPVPDPNATECHYDPTSFAAYSPGPGAEAVATYHTHPSYDGDPIYGCRPSGGVNWAQTASDNKPVRIGAPDDPKAGGGSGADWGYSGYDAYVITKSGRVYKLPITDLKKDHSKNPYKWNFKGRGCMTLIA